MPAPKGNKKEEIETFEVVMNEQGSWDLKDSQKLMVKYFIMTRYL